MSVERVVEQLAAAPRRLVGSSLPHSLSHLLNSSTRYSISCSAMRMAAAASVMVRVRRGRARKKETKKFGRSVCRRARRSTIHFPFHSSLARSPPRRVPAPLQSPGRAPTWNPSLCQRAPPCPPLKKTNAAARAAADRRHAQEKDLLRVPGDQGPRKEERVFRFFCCWLFFWWGRS